MSTGSQQNQNPVWITGFFRSGSSLTGRIISLLGGDVGPKIDLLQPIGPRKHFNPEGFYENFLFMDTSLYLFQLLNSWGHQPPTDVDVETLSLKDIVYEDYVRFSMVDVHDERVPNREKKRILRRYYPGNLNQYLANEFTSRPFIKNPHFSVLWKWLITDWPASEFLIVFRNPESTVDSAKGITPEMSYNLYNEYFGRILSDTGVKATYFSYNNLIQNPEMSISKLAHSMELSTQHVSNAAGVINHNLVRHHKETSIKTPEETKEIYSRMMDRAINKL